jgi:hypothetical protein
MLEHSKAILIKDFIRVEEKNKMKLTFLALLGQQQ